MSDFLWAGTVIGALIGFLNMLSIVTSRLGAGLSPPKTVWQGLWTWALWTVFGAYVLALWALGCVLLGASRLMPGRSVR